MMQRGLHCEKKLELGEYLRRMRTGCHNGYRSSCRQEEHASVRAQLWTEPELDEQTRPGLREGHYQCVTGIRDQYATLS